MASTNTTTVYDLGPLGPIEYQRAWDIQRDLVQRRIEGTIGNALLLLDHFHVYTLGRRGKMDDVLLSAVELAKVGVAVHAVDRGGEVTYHGPGQLVGYPILDLRAIGGPVRYVRGLESALVDALKIFGIAAHTLEGLPGVWLGEGEQRRKIAAIGVRVSRGVSSHGFALNISTDLAYFQHIVACGMPGLAVTSMEQELSRDVDAGDVRRAVVAALEQRLGLVMRWADEAEVRSLANPVETASEDGA
jgi:lipoyl(octanoyl) transferase